MSLTTRESTGQIHIGVPRMIIRALAISGLALGALGWLPARAAGGTTVTFSYTGSEQTFTVPLGMTSITVTAIGGRGGAGGGTIDQSGRPSAGAMGGDGASVSATVPVTPGETLYVEVGGNGRECEGGWNGGGYGGIGLTASECASVYQAGGGGGGASAVQTCSVSNSSCTLTGVPATDPRLLVAAGGGGGGGRGTAGLGGAGGSASDASGNGEFGGYGSPDGSTNGGGNGQGATQTAAGTGGVAGGAGVLSGTNGAAGSGGNGSGNGAFNDGGGGGAGFFGGGGGGQGNLFPVNGTFIFGGGGGAGAGSSYVESSATSVSYTSDTSGVPQITISYSGPTVTYLSDLAVQKHGTGRVLHWRLTNPRGVVGFNVYSGKHRLNTRLIVAHGLGQYSYRVRQTGSRHYTLGIVLQGGGEIKMPVT